MNPTEPNNNSPLFPSGGSDNPNAGGYNPYSSTIPATSGASISPGDAGMVGHMQVISILQIVFGVLELFMGGLFAFYAIMINVMGPQMANGRSDPPPEVMFWVGIGLALGATVIILFAVLRISSGIRSIWFRGRTMLLISLIGGMVTVFTCYCAPFSIGVGIYGLVVLFNPSVALAFKMAEDGVPPEEIRAHFARARYGF